MFKAARLGRVPRKLQADLSLIFCALIWGATFVLVKDALAGASVFVFLALRFLLATFVLVLIYGRELRRVGARRISRRSAHRLLHVWRLRVPDGRASP